MKSFQVKNLLKCTDIFTVNSLLIKKKRNFTSTRCKKSSSSIKNSFSNPQTLKLPSNNQTSSIFDILDTPSATIVPKKLRFNYAASSIPKNQAKQNSINFDTSSLLSHQVGEDSYFNRKDSLGVADGVGGWVSVKGANPALYSRMMMHFAAKEFGMMDEFDLENDPEPLLSPKEVLWKCYNKVKELERNDGLVGSTTSLICQLKYDELSVVNLGDCGLMVIRDNKTLFRSEEQQHSFNFPFQLGTGSRDNPEQAQEFTLKLKENDIVLIASDGIFDNVFDDDILDIVKKCFFEFGNNINYNNPNTAGSNIQLDPKLFEKNLNKKIKHIFNTIDPKIISDAILLNARLIAEDNRANSPFSSKAIQEGIYFQGGKMDDMTCIVGFVRLDEDSPDRR